MSQRSLRLTWAWLWALLAFASLAAVTVFIAAIAVGGGDRGDVALAVLLIGLPALLAVFAMGTLALIMARPSGARWKAVRRWGLALVGAVALLMGLANLGAGAGGAIPLIVAGASALAFLALDVRRGRGE